MPPMLRAVGLPKSTEDLRPFILLRIFCNKSKSMAHSEKPNENRQKFWLITLLFSTFLSELSIFVFVEYIILP